MYYDPWNNQPHHNELFPSQVNIPQQLSQPWGEELEKSLEAFADLIAEKTYQKLKQDFQPPMFGAGPTGPVVPEGLCGWESCTRPFTCTEPHGCIIFGEHS